MKKLVRWVEIPSNNFGRAVRFYNTVFNLNMEAIDCGDEKMACFPSGDGAISYAKGFNPSAEGTLVSFSCEDKLDETIKLVQEHGGKMVQGKTKIEAENMGYFALIIDSEGNKVGLHGTK